MTSLLMCPPQYYEIAYEINPWMSIARKADKKEAQRQWQAYYDLLTSKLKIEVELLTPVPNLPDLVFTANGGILRKNVFVLSNFRFKERRNEERHFEAWA